MNCTVSMKHVWLAFLGGCYRKSCKSCWFQNDNETCYIYCNRSLKYTALVYSTQRLTEILEKKQKTVEAVRRDISIYLQIYRYIIWSHFLQWIMHPRAQDNTRCLQTYHNDTVMVYAVQFLRHWLGLLLFAVCPVSSVVEQDCKSCISTLLFMQSHKKTNFLTSSHTGTCCRNKGNIVVLMVNCFRRAVKQSHSVIMSEWCCRSQFQQAWYYGYYYNKWLNYKACLKLIRLSVQLMFVCLTDKSWL